MDTLEVDFRKTIQLQNDVMDLVAGMGYNELTRGIFEHKVNTEEEKKVEKKARERLNKLLREIRENNLENNYVDSDQSPLKGIEAQVKNDRRNSGGTLRQRENKEKKEKKEKKQNKEKKEK